MKKFRKFIREDLTGALVEPKSNSSSEAQKRGLQYVGFGRYMDPQVNQVTHIAQNDQLVPFSKAIRTNTYQQNSSDDFGSYAKNLQSDISQIASVLLSSYPPELFDNDELDAIQAYTSEMYDAINARLSALPSGIPAEQIQPQDQMDTVPSTVAALDSALSKVPAPIDFITFASLNSSYTIDQFSPGQTFTFKSFRSTSLNPNLALNTTGGNPRGQAIVLQITVPRGSSGMYVDDYSIKSGESEYLLSRGTQLAVESEPYFLQGSNAYTQDQNLNVNLILCRLVK